MAFKYTLKLILWTHDSKADNKYPVYLRITIAGERAYLATGISTLKSLWNEKDEQIKGGKNTADLNAQIHDFKSRVLRKITDIQLEGKTITAKQLKNLFAIADLNNLFEFTEQFIKEVQHKREAGTLENYRKHLLKLEQYVGSRNIAFEEITPQWLGKYEHSLRAEGLSNNYVHALFKTLKLVFNAAIKKKIISEYPFDQYENPVYKAPVKDYLTLDEIKKWEELIPEIKDPSVLESAIYFLLGIATGLRVSDWKTFDPEKHIKNGSVLLQAKKNGEWVSMPVNQILERNIERMKEHPLTIDEHTVNRKLKFIADKLGIKKRLTCHSARHTFAIEICANRGLSVEVTASVMGISIETAIENYYKVTQRKINEEVLRAWQGL